MSVDLYVEKMRVFLAGRVAYITLPLKTDAHKIFCTGQSGATDKGKSLRMLVKTSLVFSMLSNGDLGDKGVQFLVADVMPDTSETPLHFMQSEKYYGLITFRPFAFEDMTNNGVGYFKMIEMSPEFDTKSDRYQFMLIAKGTNTMEEWLCERKKYLQIWATLLVAEKRRQFDAMLYDQKHIPWIVEDEWSMPVVIWVCQYMQKRKH
jgi:hypothetical protein